MKTLTTVLLTFAVASAALSAQSADRREQELAICTAELQAYYGPQTQITLVDRKRGLYGTHLKVAARVDGDSGHFATCWVDAEQLVLNHQGEQLAAVETPSE